MQKGKVKDLLLWTFLAIILGLAMSFAFLPLLGVNPIESLKIMLMETFADKFSMGNILVKTTPLILTSLAFAFTYKANLYNIGAQGQFYVGCICRERPGRLSYRPSHRFSESKIQCQ